MSNSLSEGTQFFSHFTQSTDKVMEDTVYLHPLKDKGNMGASRIWENKRFTLLSGKRSGFVGGTNISINIYVVHVHYPNDRSLLTVEIPIPHHEIRKFKIDSGDENAITQLCEKIVQLAIKQNPSIIFGIFEAGFNSGKRVGKYEAQTAIKKALEID